MTKKSLQRQIDAAGTPLEYLRSNKAHRHSNRDWDPKLIVPQVPYEFTDWEREQRAWRDGVALLDQSHHMQAVIISGPDAKRFLSHMACNNLANANPSRAFQIICVAPNGYMVGDGILLQLEENKFSAIGPFILNWLAYHAEILDFDVTASIDPRSPVYANGYANTRPDCRYQIQGPKAWALIEKLNGGKVEDVSFFNVTEINVAGYRMRGLRHGMAGTPGLEIWGPWEARDKIRGTILEAGEEFGILEVGAAAYLSSAIESGWLQSVLPAIYTDNDLRAYREWVPGDHLEGLTRVTGSQKRATLEEYYRTPQDIGYGRFVHMDHEFVGRDALRALIDRPKLQKVTLAWDQDDAANLFKEMLMPEGKDVRFLHLPVMCDKIDIQYFSVTSGGKEVGTAHYTSYLATERALLTLSLVDESLKIGDEVTLHWGEAGGGFGNHMTPSTDIVPIRAIVSPAPYSRVAREDYRKN
ncbi:aminomethyl transferase family protein [Rhizobium sp. P38BS-XIX]|uniref:aminomethyl transferase family protein n=1 Tax=Rhizobium sp. P38BS-XIX TaxID=2726740 RepID=UPI0014563D10|nr:aminomethyl transferase family protein [Rhizobium sp. P38BS-XIX]NLR97351.1 aminomethyl transferase family protein [Rhizobium sp. P38BS-XIX]